MQFKTIEQVWNAIEQGQTVYWVNESYKLTIETALLENHFSNKNGKCLRVTYISNWFGSILDKSELPKLFTK